MKSRQLPDVFGAVEFSKKKLQIIFDHLEPMCLVDGDMRIMRLNRAMADFLAGRFDSLIGKSLADVMKGLDGTLWSAKINYVLSSRRSAQLNDYAIHDGSKKAWYEITFYPIVEREDRVEECVVYFKNVTELYLTKKILLEQYKRLEDQQMVLETKNALLLETRKSLDDAYSSLVEELEVAREVQQGILPKQLPDVQGIRFYASYDPVSKVGGDLYDILDLGGNRMGIFIGDVSGHGLPAAFVAAMVKMALVDHARGCPSPRDLFRVLNENLLRHLKSDHYLTAFYGILDLSDFSFTYCKASHPQPILVREGGETLLLDTKGMFLGLMEKPGYEESSIQLRKGDRIYFFTDGYFEFRAVEGRRFTYQNLADLVQEVNALEPREAQRTLTAKLKGVTGDGELEDDRTLVIVEISADKPADEAVVVEAFPGHDAIVLRRFTTENQFDRLFYELEEYTERHLSSPELRRQVNVCAIELANNALEHGNKRDAEKTVQFAYRITPSEIRMVVRDEGEGFSPEAVPDPRAGNNWRRERGRGIFIVRSFMDEVRFNPTGNMVTVVKHLRRKDDISRPGNF